MTPHCYSRRLATRAVALAALAAPMGIASIDLRAADENRGAAPNYELAAQWTVPKINKMIFDTQVTPHWLELSDRFWYSYETRDGKRYFIVDLATPRTGSASVGAGSANAAARTVKAPLFDNAKMAAMLAAATLVPMDAQHLPIKSLKFVNKDTALQLEVEVPKEAEIPGLKKK